jgi:hypothetical protein
MTIWKKLEKKRKSAKRRFKKIRLKRKLNNNKNEEKRLKKLEEEEEIKRIDLEQKHKEVEEKIKMIEEERKRKIEIMIENTRKIEAPRYKEIEKSYETNVLMPTLEQKKKALASIRDLHKPIRMNYIMEHKKKIDKIIEKRRVEHDENMPKDDFTYKKYETNWIQKVKDQVVVAKKEKEKKDTEKREIFEKMRTYGDMVKEMHWPAVSKKKQLEMKLLMQSSNHPHLSKSDLGSRHGGNRRSAENLSAYPKTDKDDDDSVTNATTKRRK